MRALTDQVRMNGDDRTKSLVAIEVSIHAWEKRFVELPSSGARLSGP